MLREALEYLRDRFVGAATAEVLTPFPGDIEAGIARIVIEGKMEVIDGLKQYRPARDYQAQSVEAFIEMVNGFKKASHNLGKPTPAIFVFGGGAKCVLDEDGDQVNAINMAFDRTTAMLQADNGFSDGKQKDILRWLRLIFRDSVKPESLVEQLRQLTWDRSDKGGANLRPGKESLAAETVRQLDGAGELFPNEITLTCPVFKQLPEFTVDIKCSFDVDVDAMTFLVAPIAGEIQTATLKALTHIKKEVEEATSVQTYIGS